MKKLLILLLALFACQPAYAQFVMPYPNPVSSTPFAASYWIPAQINFSPVDGTGNLMWYGYASQADYTAGKANIGSHAYPLNAATVTALLTALGLTMTQFEAPLYPYAQSINDTVITPASGDTPAVMGSFFAGAQAAK